MQTQANPRFFRARNILALACAAALHATPILAQDINDAAKLETVTVTGSRISNPNVVSPTPLSTITADDIKAVGAVNIGDVMTRLPQLSSTFTMGNSGRFIGTVGLAQQDLRNLGPNRTLVLVNGRRFVGSSAGSTAVDVNLIPADWIDRVEIITGGASAIYGADAVTGVVNFILKKNYQGANLHAQYGTSEHGGFNQRLISMTGGMNFAQDRGNIAVSVEHSDTSAMNFGDRFGRKSYRAILADGGPNTVLQSGAGNYTTAEGGTFSLGGTTDISKRYVFNPDGSVRPQRFSGLADARGNCANCDYVDLNQLSQLQPRYGRTTLSTVASFDMTPEHRLYFEGTYSHTDVKDYSQPAFGTYTISRDNAYVSPSLAALMDANGLDSLDINRFDVDAGRRGEDIGRNTARAVFGVNGVIAGDWEYDASLNYGQTNETRYNLNNRLVDRFDASIDAVRDPATGNIVCRSSLGAGAMAGCIPTSIFGAGAIDPAAAQWFNTTTTTKSRLTQFVGGGSVTNNNLFQMPFDAGAASMAAGVEFRRETSRQTNDPLDVDGLTFLNAIPSSGGAYNVKEGYIETALPLLTGKTLVKNLTFDAAVRFSDYSTVGHTKAWRWGLDWAIDDSVRLRGTMSSAVRAPNIDELFSGQSQNFYTVNDPCSANQIPNGRDPAIRAANCAALGIPTGFVSSNAATITGVSGSNPNLRPEQGRTWTAGMVLTPTFLPGFGMTLDYWNIRLTDAITSISAQNTLNNCVDAAKSIDNVYCNSFTRDPVTHEVDFIGTQEQNISAISTSGVDIGAYYSHELGAGKMRWNVNATKVIAYTEQPFQDDPSQTVQQNGVIGFPKWKAALGATYMLNDWAFNWNTRYFSRMLRVSRESFASNPMQANPIRAGAGFFNDIKASYTFKKSGWQAYIGINNVFDRNPPVNMFGTDFGSALYDGIGRNYYAGFNYNFM
jgi:iron complex outermembrane recepter protein